MEQSFGVLVREYHQMVFVYCLSLLNDKHLAEDLTQETFVVAYQKRRSFSEIRDFGSWLRGVVRNLAMTHRRKSMRLRFVSLERLSERTERNFRQEGDPGAWKDRIDALRRCLEKIDAGLRTILDLHYSDSLRAAAIAAKVGKSEATVWQAMSRGRRLLKSCVDGELSSNEGGSV